MEFLGWYTESGDKFTDFETALTVTENTEITLTARFEEAYYVYFLSAENGDIAFTKKGANGDEISTSDVTIQLKPNTALTGWKDASGNTVGSTVTISGANITLTPVIESGYWITYESGDGASYIEPVFVAPSALTEAPTAPTRPGYTFSHWSLTEGGEEYAFGTAITDSITLYAVWTPRTDTQYTVIHWWENADD